jgi:hypothetical protein
MDWTSLLRTVAPWIGAALGGPLGSAAVELATQALGVSEKTSDGLKKALAGVTPEQMLALKKADQDFQARMKELGIAEVKDLEKIAADDRANARDMQKTNKSWVPAALSVGVTAGYFVILLAMMLGKLHVADSQALLLMLGSLTTAWGGVIAYWFGSTASSAEKTRLLAKSQPVE